MATRPTKKQKQLLEYIESFIAQNGYSPSYREIMQGVGYSSVATVAVHVNNLVMRGHLIKRDNAARTLEPIKTIDDEHDMSISKTQSAWLFEQLEQRFKQVSIQKNETTIDEIYILIGAVKVLGFKDQAVSFITRLREVE